MRNKILLPIVLALASHAGAQAPKSRQFGGGSQCGIAETEKGRLIGSGAGTDKAILVQWKLS
jgi:hypothetical protein